MAETRKHKRAPVALKVRFKSATVDEFIEQYSYDVSHGGIFIKSGSPMKVGTLLKFQFQLQDESPLIRGVGRVVWVRSEDVATSEKPAGMGIKFIKIDEESRVVIDRIIGTHEGEPGAFEKGAREQGASVSTMPPPAVVADKKPGGFFPDTTPEHELPPPEDRTAVRHASEFLASALSGASADSAAQAEKVAEDTRKRAEEQARRRRDAEKRMVQEVSTPSIVLDPSLSQDTAQEEDRPTQERALPVQSERVRTHPSKPMPVASAVTSKPAPAVPSARPVKSTGPAAPRTRLEQTTASVEPAVAAPAKSRGLGVRVAVIGLVVAIGAYLALQDSPEPVVTESPEPAPAIEPVAATPAPAPEPTPEPAPAPVVEPMPPPAPEPPAEPRAKINVKVWSVPPRADLFVGERAMGKSPSTFELEEGVPVTVRARAPGRKEASVEVTPNAETDSVKLVLDVLPYVLRIETTPAGAALTIDNKSATSPADVELMPRGPKINVSAKLEGYKTARAAVPVSRFVEAPDAMHAALKLELTAVAASPAAAPRPAPAVAPAPKPAPLPKPAPAAKPPAEPKPAPATEPRPAPAPVEVKPVPVEPAPAPAPKPSAKPKPLPPPPPPPAAPEVPDNPFG